MLQQLLPFTVLKPSDKIPEKEVKAGTLQQLLPFTVLKLLVLAFTAFSASCVATALTVYGIETIKSTLLINDLTTLQQLLPFTVCAEGCETAEEQSDDEVRTSQVPERSEGKTKVIRDSAYRLRY